MIEEGASIFEKWVMSFSVTGVKCEQAAAVENCERRRQEPCLAQRRETNIIVTWVWRKASNAPYVAYVRNQVRESPVARSPLSFIHAGQRWPPSKHRPSAHG